MDLLRLIRHRWLGRLVLLLAAVGGFAPLHAQAPPAFDRVEYFFDSDPGQGQGTAVSLPSTTATTLSNLPFTVSLAPLTPGFHSLFIRSRAGGSNWSQTYRQILYKEAATSSSAAPNLVKAEYFVDADPGYDAGTAIAITGSGNNAAGVAFTVGLGSVGSGFHTLSIRSKDVNGAWSQTYRQIFYVEPRTTTAPAPALVGAEYFIDADPGYGAGTPIAITGSSSNAAGVSFTVGLGSVSAGFHSLSVRSKDANGAWSQTYRQIFYVEPATTTAPPANLAAVEYFVDNDPGYGLGSSAAITGGGINATGVSFSVGLGSLSVGFHTLFYRVRDAAGKWSQTQNRIFYVDDPTVAAIPNINKAEYYFDTDPGYGLGVNVPIATPATNITNLNLLADASALSTGQHRLFVRVRDANGGWSQVLNRAFAKSGCNSSPNYAANQPSASYTGFGITATAVEQMYNGLAITGGSSTFFNSYYAQVDLGASTLRTISEVQLSLRNVNGTAVSYTLTIEASGNLSTWSTIDTYTATLPANQATPTNIVRTLATVQNNVRGLRLRLTLPTLAQGIQLTNAGVYFFPATCPVPVIISFTPASGPAGTVVTVTGTNLDGATAVTFNGTPAGPITNNTASGFTVPAPVGGTDGQICVTTSGGTACSGASYLYPPAIATGTVSTSAYCTGNTITVPFSTNTSRYATGNVFNFQLSDASGVFAANAPLLGTLQSSSANGGVLTGTIPQTTQAGSGYRVRVVASNPAVTGTDNGANLTIGTTPVSQATGPASVANGATINLGVTPTYSGATYSWSGPNGFTSTQQSPSTSTTTAGVARYYLTVTLGNCSYNSFVDVNVQVSTAPILAMSTFGGSLCLGETRTISFAVTGNPFPSGNTMMAQLSDASGSFAAPVSIGSTSFSGQGNGSFAATIPASATAGSGYRIRVISSNPVIISNDNGSSLTLNALPTVTVSSNSPVAQAGTIVLNGGPAVAGNTYVWTVAYTGGGSATVGTTQNLSLTNAQPAQSGNYTLTITNAAGCSASASTAVTVNAAVPVTTLSLNALTGPLCAGTGYTLGYTASGPSFGAGNTITAQLSDAFGSFTTPVSIGSVSTTAAANGTLGVVVPTSTVAGTGYRIRLVSSSPVITTNDNGSSLTITNLSTASAGSNSPVTAGSPISLTATGISGATYSWTGPNGFTATGPNQNIASATAANAGTYSVTISLNGCSTMVNVAVVVNAPAPVTTLTLNALTGPLCAGTGYTLSYTASGPSFGAGNIITAQLSDVGGSFAAPVSIGSVSTTAAANGTLGVVVPASASGAGYRIRLVSSNPAITSNDNGSSLTITNLSTASAGSNSPVTAGSPISLTATGISGATYSWTGPNGFTATGPNQNIASATAANAGTYSVTISLNGCSTTVNVAVVVNAAPVVASIQTSSLASGYCAGSALSVSFTATGFTTGNVFAVQLSAAGGSFAGTPVYIGALTGTASGTIAAVIPASTAPGAGYRIRVLGTQPATVGADNGADILIGAANAYTWLGAVSTSWSTAANWSCGTVPTATSDVVIPAGLSLYPVAGAGSTAQNLIIASGASLTLAGQFVLTGNLVNNGTFAPGTSALVCGGSAAQSLGGSGTLRFYDLILSNAAGATLTSAAGVQHLLTLTAGNLASGNNLTLLSDATGTAMVVNPTGGGVVTGRATMQRFVMGAATAGYRHYSSPMQTGTATVQDFADNIPNFNVNPAYNTQGNTVSPFPTLFQYSEARLTTAAPTFDQGWMVPGATDNLTPGRGYSAQTLPGTLVDISGTLASADVSYPVTRGPLANSGWQLLGNPFPSPLDWDQVPAVAGIDRALYVFVPSGPYTGTYRSYIAGIGQNGGTKDLASMQGFFVRATSAASLSLPAAARASTYLNPGFNRTATTTTRPLGRLQAQNANGQADEAVVYFDPAATPGFDAAFDAYKVQLNGSGTPSLWSVAGTDALSINALPNLVAVPSIPLGVRVSQSGPHTLEATELLNLPPGTEVWLEDRELGTRQNLTLTPAYAFTMSASYTGQRFYLWLQPSGVLSTATGALQAATHLYPNPTTSTATLEMAGLSGSGDVQLQLLNALGQVVLERRTQPRAGILREQLDLTHLATGVYSVRVVTPQGTVVKRLTRE